MDHASRDTKIQAVPPLASIVGIILTVAIVLTTAVKIPAALVFRGVARTVDSSPVARAEVRIDGAGSYVTTDSGQFTIPESDELKVDTEVVFHVTHWVVVRPCEYRNGRTYLPPPRRIIEIKVLRRTDPRLRAIAPSESVIGCTIEEAASLFPQKSKPNSSSTSPLLGQPASRFSVPSSLAVLLLIPDSLGHNQDSHTPVTLNERRVPSSGIAFIIPHYRGEGANDRSEFLARKADEFGFSPEEFNLAINSWAKSAETPYERGLALFWQGRFSEASKRLSEAIRSAEVSEVRMYVPLARAEYEQGHYKEAASALQKVLSLHPSDSVIKKDLALTLDMGGPSENARGSLPPSVAREVIIALYSLLGVVGLWILYLVVRAVFESQRQKRKLLQRVSDLREAKSKQCEEHRVYQKGK
jgi:hypothetical protein